MTGKEAIEIDRGTGRVTGASPSERLGIGAMIAAGYALKGVGDLGFSHAARTLSGLLPSKKAIRLHYPDGSIFEFPYGDPYWSVILRKGRIYEKGVEAALSVLGREQFVYVDCGANYGYWSVLMSGERFGHHPVVAVEAAPDTYRVLARNAENNGGRFAAINRAISDTAGQIVRIYGAKHEARSIVGGEGRVVAEVETISLDRLMDREELADADRIVLKLDVEGMEVAALKGGARLLEREVLVIYEDHGSDREHSVSSHLKSVLGMKLYAVENGMVRELDAVSELDSIKTNRRWGYDFFATRSPFWTEQMAGLVAGRV